MTKVCLTCDVYMDEWTHRDKWNIQLGLFWSSHLIPRVSDFGPTKWVRLASNVSWVKIDWKSLLFVLWKTNLTHLWPKSDIPVYFTQWSCDFDFMNIFYIKIYYQMIKYRFLLLFCWWINNYLYWYYTECRSSLGQIRSKTKNTA